MAATGTLVRLIVVPQYPSKLRYQSWWVSRLREYEPYFDEVLILNPDMGSQSSPLGQFAPMQAAVDYEIRQMHMFNNLNLRKTDILLHCDLSFPGLFHSVLYHKRPEKCFAICHATSLNRYDYFAPQRPSKWKVEEGNSKLYDTIFVASNYHYNRLGWPNAKIVRFPLPRLRNLVNNRLGIAQAHTREFVSVARKGIQKIDLKLEKEFERKTGYDILRFYQTKGKDWSDYYGFVESGKMLIVSSREETYGYQIIDALSVDTVPLAPRSLSYPELLPEDNLYDPRNVDSLVEAYFRNLTKPSLPSLWSDTFIEQTARDMLR